MNVVSAVANLQKEKDYYESALKESQKVIEQLSEGPGETILIHPYDFAELLDVLTAHSEEPIELRKLRKYEQGDNSFDVQEVGGKRYRLSVWMPRGKSPHKIS